jgi:hypothetical protein
MLVLEEEVVMMALFLAVVVVMETESLWEALNLAVVEVNKSELVTDLFDKVQVFLICSWILEFLPF